MATRLLQQAVAAPPVRCQQRRAFLRRLGVGPTAERLHRSAQSPLRRSASFLEEWRRSRSVTTGKSSVPDHHSYSQSRPFTSSGPSGISLFDSYLSCHRRPSCSLPRESLASRMGSRRRPLATGVVAVSLNRATRLRILGVEVSRRSGVSEGAREWAWVTPQAGSITGTNREAGAGVDGPLSSSSWNN